MASKRHELSHELLLKILKTLDEGTFVITPNQMQEILRFSIDSWSALKFYASEKSYYTGGSFETAPVMKDAGKWAKKTLDGEARI